MDIIYLILLFIAPGMIIRHTKRATSWTKPNKVNLYDFLFKVVSPSIAIDIIAILILNLSNYWETPTIDHVIDNIKAFKGLGQFSLAAFLVGLVGYLLWYKLLKGIYIALINKILSDRHVEYKDISTWEKVLTSEDIASSWQVISVYNNDRYVTSGMLLTRDTSDYENINLLLEYTDKVEELKKARPDLFVKWYDYYNPSNGLRVVFYKQDLIEEHWKDYFVE